MQPLRPLRPLWPLLSQKGQRPDMTTTTTSTPCTYTHTYTHTRPPATTTRRLSTTPASRSPRVAPGTIIPKPAPRVSPRVQRPEWQMHPDTPLYELPSSVIDLDAIDNPNVRPYDEEVDGFYEKQKWSEAHASIDDLSEQLTLTKQQIAAAKLRMQVMKNQRTPWQVLDKDVWVAVMDIRDAGHGNVLHHNGISGRLAATPEKVPLLLNRAVLARDILDATLNMATVFMESLGKARTPTEVRRVVALTLQTEEGRDALLRCNMVVAQKLAAFIELRNWGKYGVSNERDTANQITDMLLNWSYAIALKGEEYLDRASSLWAVGMWTAALANRITAIRRFLQIGLGKGSAGDCKQLLATYTSPEAQNVGASAAAAALDVVLDRMWHKPEALDGARAELFSLVTGVHLLRPAPDAGPEVSFRVLLAHLPPKTPFKDLYTDALAELGAVRTLWEITDKEKIASNPSPLVTATLRYAAYLDTLTRPSILATTASSPSPTATTGLDKSAANSSVWDLQTIVDYEAKWAVQRQEPTIFPTLRPRPTGPDFDPDFMVDNAFKAGVIAAFSKPSAEEAVQAINAFLQPLIEIERLRQREKESDESDPLYINADS